MMRIVRYVQQRMSLRLGIVIVFIVTVVFALLFDFLFYRAKSFIQRAAIQRASQLLDNTAERINGIIDETETVTNFMAQTTPHHLTPDSLLAFSRRTVAENPFLAGFAISMEPNFFPEMGRYFSAYSLRHHMSADESAGIPDSITTVREGPFEYFDAVWYKTPRTLGKACWIEAFDDYNEGTLSSPDILTSYCCPMRDANGQYIGSMTASLTLKWLSEIISPLKPYPNSSAIMIGHTGTYLVHPDTAKIYRESIFSDPDPRVRSEIEAMGRDMLAGHSGVLQTIVDDNPAFILYRPLERTGWSIAIVCPESDISARYNSLLTTVWIIVGIGLLLLMLFCYLIVRRAIQPLSQLDLAARRIAGGQFDVPLSESPRRDSIGRLNNSFVSMQQSLAESVANIQHVNAELEQQNEELTRAYQLKLETNRQKTIFIQDMYHQIRTPLNIISGFTQVLSENLRMLPADEVADITTRIKESAADISRLTKELSD